MKINVTDIIEKYSPEQRYALAILQDIQKAYNYISREAMEEVAQYLKLPLTKLYSMSTFYKAFSLKPKGKNIIKVCDGTACHIKSSMVILAEIEKTLGIKAGETTKDGVFSIETVNCMGSCALSPVMVVNEDYYGKVTPSQVPGIINKYRGEEDGK